MNPTRFHIDATHPALPGHFPGRPVVPGVVLLDRVAAAVEREFGARIVALPQVKFLSPLLPDQEVELCIEEKDKRMHFSFFHKDTLLANGIAEIEAAA